MNTFNKKLESIVLFIFCLLILLFPSYSKAQQVLHNAENSKRTQGGYTVKVLVLSATDNLPLIMAHCMLSPLGAFSASDMNGYAVFKNVPDGEYFFECTYVGFEPLKQKIVVNGNDVEKEFKVEESTLAIDQVVVTAKSNISGEATASHIGRQAIDHVQAFSLSDVMQLIPGQTMTSTDLTQKSNLQLRGLVNDNNNAFGAQIVVDGMPMSNNGEVSQGGFSSTSFVGTDLRQVSADDVESVEVIRGIPSAEYGDLTSGLVVVNSKIGYTPLSIKAKINPSAQNFSFGKGIKSKKTGTININGDYVKAWGDPRNKTKSYDRYTVSAGWSYDISNHWSTTTKLRYVYSKDWNGDDPDAKSSGIETKDVNQNIVVTHNGKISLNKLFSRTLSYTIGASLKNSDSYSTKIIPNSNGFLPILTARETGYHTVSWQTSSYLASGGTISKPGNVYAKINNSFYVKSGDIKQTFKIGADYHYDWNNAKGYYNDNDELPLVPNENGRPRAFSDIPGLHQVSAFAEDNFSWKFNEVNIFKLQAGIRFTGIQLFKDESCYSFSPRINASFTVAKWLDIHAGYGMNSKTPSLAYLYPDKKYSDHQSAMYLPQSDPVAQYVMYYTEVYDVQRTLGLKNATNTKTEAGFDIKLPGNRKIGVTAYNDKTDNGFGSLIDYYTYTVNYYNTEQGLITSSGDVTTVDWNNPARVDTFFSTKGTIGNISVSLNRGIELDCDLGEIPLIRTSVFLTGAYQESQTWSKDNECSSPVSIPVSYTQYGTTPFKLVYPSEKLKNVYRKASTTLRFVTHIPSLKMVASYSAEAIWYSYSHNITPERSPLGWIDTDMTYHEITPEMLADESYTIKGVSLIKQIKTSTDAVPVKNPVTWLICGRLTKDLGKSAGISFYVNNLLYYEPFKASSTSNTLTQRNSGKFGFGVELYFNL